MIELKGIWKTYGEHVIFEDLNLTIEDGDFVILSGESGRGKTTILNMVGGLVKPDKGKVIVNGTDIYQQKSLHHYYSEEIGFLFQNFALVENRTVEYNLNMIGRKNRSETTVNDALKYVGLSDAQKKKVYTLSGGEQQRIALARLLIKKCKIILADEPTGSLDRRNAETVMKLLRQMNQEGKTVVLVTHDEAIKNQGKKVIAL